MVKVRFLASAAGAVMIAAGEVREITEKEAKALAAIGYVEILQPDGSAGAEKREKAVKAEKTEKG